MANHILYYCDKHGWVMATECSCRKGAHVLVSDGLCTAINEAKYA